MADAASPTQRPGAVSGAIKRLIVLAGLGLLAGCATIVPRGQPEAAPPPAAPRPSAPATSTLPEDVARHRVALLVPLTGTNGAVGRSLANATQLAQLDTKSEAIRITSYDTAGDAAAAATRAIAEGNQLILGPLLSEDVRAVAPIAKRAGVPVLSFSNDVSVAGNGAYVLGYSPVQSIDRVVDYAKASGITSFAGLMPRGLYGERASTAFVHAVQRAGGQIVTIQNYDRSAGSITAAVGKMVKTSPFQAVLIADSGGTAAMAVPVIRKNGVTARVLGTELWNTDSAIGNQASLNGAWFASVSDNLYRQYAAKYRARFGTAPFRLSSLGYDSVLLTIRIARDWRMGDRFPEAQLIDRGGFAGLDGAFRFGRDGIAERSLEVQEIRSGGAVTVSPAPAGFAR
jgi:ABC-type branched-subunit amino acid transport system substrate-binding protein